MATKDMKDSILNKTTRKRNTSKHASIFFRAKEMRFEERYLPILVASFSNQLANKSPSTPIHEI